MKDRILIYSVIISVHLIIISLFVFTGSEEVNEEEMHNKTNSTDEKTIDISDSSILTNSDANNDKTPEQFRNELLTDLTSVPNGKQTYVVQPGDSLMLISKKFYGKSKYYNYIYEANKDILKSPSSVRSGQTLTIPPSP